MEALAGYGHEYMPIQGPVTRVVIGAWRGRRSALHWPARRPGKRLIYCHIPHHTENDHVEEHGGGGLMMMIFAYRKAKSHANPVRREPGRRLAGS